MGSISTVSSQTFKTYCFMAQKEGREEERRKDEESERRRRRRGEERRRRERRRRRELLGTWSEEQTCGGAGEMEVVVVDR